MKTNDACGENHIHLNGETLNFTWDGTNAIGEGRLALQRSNINENNDLIFNWRSLCVASPHDSIEEYAAQILTVTFYPAARGESNITSGFAVSFNSKDKPTLLRLAASPIDLSDDDTVDTWLDVSASESLQVQSKLADGTVDFGDLEEELKQLQYLKQQKQILDNMIREKDYRIRMHLFKDCSCLTAKLKECDTLQCFVGATFKVVPDLFRLIKYRFVSLPSTFSGTPCLPSSSDGDEKKVGDVSSKNSTIPSSNITIEAGFKPDSNEFVPFQPKISPSNFGFEDVPAAHHSLRNFAILCVLIALFCLGFRYCRNSMFWRRRKADRAARREERRARQAYRAAACRHRLRQWWNGTSCQNEGYSNDPARQGLVRFNIPPAEQGAVNSESAQPRESESNMGNEILGLRRVLEFVGDLVRPDEPPPYYYSRDRRRQVLPDFVAINANRSLAGTPAPSSTTPLTTIGSPRTSTVLSLETDSLDTIDSLDPDTASMLRT